MPAPLNNKNAFLLPDMVEVTRKNTEFANEAEFCDFLESKMRRFCSEVLEDVYISHKREFEIGSSKKVFARGIRVDFKIICRNKTYFIECKHPKSRQENMAGIGQILSYGLSGDQALVLLTDRVDWYTQAVIAKYKLPIAFYVYYQGFFFESKAIDI